MIVCDSSSPPHFNCDCPQSPNCASIFDIRLRHQPQTCACSTYIYSTSFSVPSLFSFPRLLHNARWHFNWGSSSSQSSHATSPRKTTRRLRCLGPAVRQVVGKHSARNQNSFTSTDWTVPQQWTGAMDDEYDPAIMHLLQAHWIFCNEQSASVYAWAGSLLMPKYLLLMSHRQSWMRKTD